MFLGIIIFPFWGMFLGKFWGITDFTKRKEVMMQKKNYKGKCEKRSVSKCKGVCRTYGRIQYAYADYLANNPEVKDFECNIPISNDEYTSDFYITKIDDTVCVRECVERKFISKPLTVKSLDISRSYWVSKGIEDWGIIINEEE